MHKILIISIAILWTSLCFGMEGQKDLRIGVIGAGPSGLIAAYELLKKGYENVVVLEQEPEIGGKVRTFFYDGMPYEMGAVVTARDYQIVLDIAKELDVHLVKTPKSISCSSNGEFSKMLTWSKEKYGWYRFPKLAKDFSKFSYYVHKHSAFFKPGFEETPRDMFDTVEDFMNELGADAVLEAYRPLMAGCGYGYAENKPAPYWMKLLRTFGHEYNKSVHFNSFYQGFSDGWQELWVKFARAKKIDVHLNTKVTLVTHNDDKTILVFTNQGGMVFDRLIVSVPHLAHKFMRFDADEKTVFSRVRTIAYKTTLAEIEGLPQNAHIWLRENSYQHDSEGRENDGKPVLISSNHESNIYQIYQFTERDKTSRTLLLIAEDTIKAMNGTVKKILKEETWDYFPHFDASAFRDGVHLKLIGLQGRNGIYYTGALMNFETVELSAQHAKALIEKFF